MSSMAIALVVFGSVLVSAIAAMLVARQLPHHHLNSESRDVVKFGLGVIATLTALVLGLLVASTKGTYDSHSSNVREVAAQVALLDRVLVRYGSETKDARVQLRELTQAFREQTWPTSGANSAEIDGSKLKQIGEKFFDTIADLQPKTEAQRLLKSRALELTISLGQIRQRLATQQGSSIPAAFLIMLGFWQAILFAGISLLAPRNATTIVVLFVCIFSVCGAVFLVLELDRPFEGIVRVSDAPLQTALSRMSED